MPQGGGFSFDHGIPQTVLLLFSLVAGVTTIAAFTVYGEVVLHLEQISAKFDNWFLAAVAALTFAVATLRINVAANFVSPAFDFSDMFPRRISFRRGGYVAALIVTRTAKTATKAVGTSMR